MKKGLIILPVLALALTACASPGAKKDDSQSSVVNVTWESNEADDDSDAIVIGTTEAKESSEAVASEEASTTVPEEGGEITLAFCGDMDFDDRYTNMIALRSRSNGILDCIDSSLVERMRNADICMVNNEFPYSDRGTPLQNKKFTFRAKPETAEFLNELGVDIVSLANNHAYDYGSDALLDTFDTLTSYNVKYVGAGKNLAEAMTPQYFSINGNIVSIVAATQIERSLPPDTVEATETTPGVLRTLDPEKFVSVISEAKSKSDVCIVFVHWGSENVSEYEASQKELAQAYVNAGADLIIGAHPHVLQGIEYINDVPVFYSLGNFWFNSKNLDNCLVEVKINKNALESLQFIPCRQHDCKTEEMKKGTTQDYERILADMRENSAWNVNIDENGYVSEK
ncbi:MAG: CapA family protein [Lachnospiraceae bacterium]|nr:CapA family protein [Lachnospiraceae bacterium]